METSRRKLQTALLIAALALVWAGIVAKGTPCSCEELTVSGAGMPAINGTYMYTADLVYEDYPGTDLWLGPLWVSGGWGDLYWAVVHLDGNFWLAGVFAAVSGTEYVIFYSPSGWYQDTSDRKCPPETGWDVGVGSGAPFPAPTITRAGCLCAGIGDVDGDGTVTVLDARLCFQIATGIIPGTLQQRAAADVDEDGDVDRDDARLLAEQLIGICQ